MNKRILWMIQIFFFLVIIFAYSFTWAKTIEEWKQTYINYADTWYELAKKWNYEYNKWWLEIIVNYFDNNTYTSVDWWSDLEVDEERWMTSVFQACSSRLKYLMNKDSNWVVLDNLSYSGNKGISAAKIYFLTEFRTNCSKSSNHLSFTIKSDWSDFKTINAVCLEWRWDDYISYDDNVSTGGDTINGQWVSEWKTFENFNSDFKSALEELEWNIIKKCKIDSTRNVDFLSYTLGIEHRGTDVRLIWTSIKCSKIEQNFIPSNLRDIWNKIKAFIWNNPNLAKGIKSSNVTVTDIEILDSLSQNGKREEVRKRWVEDCEDYWTDHKFNWESFKYLHEIVAVAEWEVITTVGNKQNRTVVRKKTKYKVTKLYCNTKPIDNPRVVVSFKAVSQQYISTEPKSECKWGETPKSPTSTYTVSINPPLQFGVVEWKYDDDTVKWQGTPCHWKCNSTFNKIQVSGGFECKSIEAWDVNQADDTKALCWRAMTWWKEYSVAPTVSDQLCKTWRSIDINWDITKAAIVSYPEKYWAWICEKGNNTKTQIMCSAKYKKMEEVVSEPVSERVEYSDNLIVQVIQGWAKWTSKIGDYKTYTGVFNLDVANQVCKLKGYSKYDTKKTTKSKAGNTGFPKWKNLYRLGILYCFK